MGNAVTHPVKTFSKAMGWNHKKQIIRDDEADQRIHELNVSRQNNKYVPKVTKSGTFGNLEEAIAYKEWLVENGPDSLSSPYYSSVETETKQRTSVAFWDGHPNIYINWEHQFDYNSYNRDLSNAKASILTCKQQIQDEADRFRQLIKSCESEEQYSKSQISQLKSIYQSYKDEYSGLCSKNSQLNSKVNQQSSVLILKKQEKVKKLEDLKQLQSKVKDISTELGISSYYRDEEVLSTKQKLEYKHLIDKLEPLTAQERAKLLFKIFDNKDQSHIFSIITSIGIDIDLLAYMACKFNKTQILEFALKRGASLDEYFVSEQTTIETILSLDNPDHIKLMLDHSGGFICTIINAAEHNRLDVLDQIYELNKNAFTDNDSVIGYTPAHFLLLGNYQVALEHIISLCPECLNAKTLSEESLLKVALRSANFEMVGLLITQYENITEQIRELVNSDEIELLERFISYTDNDYVLRSNIILLALQEGKDSFASNLLYGYSRMQELLEYMLSIEDDIVQEFLAKFVDDNILENHAIEDLIAGIELSEIAKADVNFLGVSDEDIDNF